MLSGSKSFKIELQAFCLYSDASMHLHHFQLPFTVHSLTPLQLFKSVACTIQ